MNPRYIPRALSLLLVLTLTSAPVDGRRSFARYQRGDQGPDMSEAGGGGGSSGEDGDEYNIGGGSSSMSSGGSSFSRTDSMVPAPIGGPNVCRSVLIINHKCLHVTSIQGMRP